MGGRPLQLPPMTVWLDADRQVVRSETDQPGLGKFTVFRTTQAVAEEEGAAPALLPDLLINNLITLDRPIDHPERAKEVVYRITLKGEDDPAAAFAQDARQQAEKAEGDTFELHVHALRTPRPDADGREAGCGIPEKHLFPRQRQRQDQGAGGGGGRRRDGPVAPGPAHREVGA